MFWRFVKTIRVKIRIAIRVVHSNSLSSSTYDRNSFSDLYPHGYSKEWNKLVALQKVVHIYTVNSLD